MMGWGKIAGTWDQWAASSAGNVFIEFGILITILFIGH
jgi:hypothetical protein